MLQLPNPQNHHSHLLSTLSSLPSPPPLYLLLNLLTTHTMLLKILAVSLIVVVGAVQAQAIIPGYPPLYQVPDVNSREVKHWLKQVDLSGAPKVPLNTGEPPSCPTEPFPDRYRLKKWSLIQSDPSPWISANQHNHKHASPKK